MVRKSQIHQGLSLVLILVFLIAAFLPASAQGLAPGKESPEFAPVDESDVSASAGPSRSKDKVSSSFKALAAPGDDGERSIYIIRLQAPSVAQYEGGIPGLKATSPRATGESKLDMR